MKDETKQISRRDLLKAGAAASAGGKSNGVPVMADAKDRQDAASAGMQGASRMNSEPPSDPLTRQIYEMADQGTTPVEIAQQLDEQVGKVELILALRSG